MHKQGGRRNAFSNAWRKAPLSRPPSLEQSKRCGGLFFVIPVNSLVDLTFKLSKNVALAHFLVVSRAAAAGLQ